MIDMKPENKKLMKLKDFKGVLDKMSPEELDQPLLYNSKNLCISGVVEGINKADEDLYYLDDDDPAQLYTKKQLLEDGYETEDIEEMTVEIPKGSYYIKF